MTIKKIYNSNLLNSKFDFNILDKFYLKTKRMKTIPLSYCRGNKCDGLCKYSMTSSRIV